MVLLLKKISKKHLKVGARTWRPPPPREHLINNNRTITNQTTTITPAIQVNSPQTTPPPTNLQQEPLPTTITNQPKPQSTHSHSQQHPHSAYSQSLNDAHQPTGSYRSHPGSQQAPHQHDYPPSPFPQTDPSHLQDIQSVHPQDSASQSILQPPPPPRTHHSPSTSCPSDIGREQLRIAQADHQAALQRMEEATRKIPLTIEPSQAHLSDTDLRPQQTLEQLEENQRRSQEIRKAQELLDIREREVKLREEQLEQMIRAEHDKAQEDDRRKRQEAEEDERRKREEAEAEDRRKREEADRLVQEAKQLAEDQYQRQLLEFELMKKKAEEEVEQTRQRHTQELLKLQEEAKIKMEEEFRQQKLREEEEKLRLEEEERQQQRREAEAEWELELETIRKEKEQMEADLRAQTAARELRNQALADQVATQNAIRGRILAKQDAMSNLRYDPNRRRAELLASTQSPLIPKFSTVSYADFYSSPILCGYTFPSCPSTPRSPHLVPEEVRNAARAADQLKKKAQEAIELEAQQKRAREQHQREAAALRDRQPFLSGNRQDRVPSVNHRRSPSRRSVNDPATDHRSALPPVQPSPLNEGSNKPYNGSRPTPVDRRGRAPHPDQRFTSPGRFSYRDDPTHSPAHRSPHSNHSHQRPPDSSRPSDPDHPTQEPNHSTSDVPPVHNRNSKNQSHRQRGYSAEGRDGLSNTNARLTQSARPAQLDYTAPIPDLVSQIASSSTSSQQPSGSDYLARVRATLHLKEQKKKEEQEAELMLQFRELEKKKEEEAELADIRAAYDQEKEKARAITREDSEGLPNKDSTGESQSHPSEQAAEDPKREKAAQAAAYFMNKPLSSNPARRRKISMPHSSSHRQATSHHHQRLNSIETVPVARSEPISESESTVPLGSISNYSNGFIEKDIESSAILRVDHPSPISYLESYPRGLQLKADGNQLARQALDASAKNLNGTVIKIHFRDPVLVDDSQVNFSAQGIALIPIGGRSPLARAGLDAYNPDPQHLPRHTDPLEDSTTPKPSFAHQGQRMPHTPDSEPFGHSESVKDSPKPHHASETLHSSISPMRDAAQEPTKMDREVQTSIGSNAAPNLHSPVTRSDSNSHHGPRHRSPDKSFNHPRGRYSPRVLEEKKYINDIGDISEKPYDLPIPPRFVTPKVTIQSPSDTTSPNPDDRGFSPSSQTYRTPSSTSHRSSPPTKQSTYQHHSSPSESTKIPFQSPSDTTSPTSPDDTYSPVTSKAFGISSPVLTSRKSTPPTYQDIQRAVLPDTTPANKPANGPVDPPTFSPPHKPGGVQSPTTPFYQCPPQVIVHSPSDTNSPILLPGAFSASPKPFSYSSPSHQSPPQTQSAASHARPSPIVQRSGLQEDLPVKRTTAGTESTSQTRIPLPPQSPWQMPLPPLTPSEFPLPSSPSISEDTCRPQSYDFKSLSKIFTPATDQPSSSSSSSSSSHRRHQERAPTRLSCPWVGDNWDILSDNFSTIHKPLTPMPLPSFRLPNHSSQSDPTLKEKINSLPLIYFDDTYPN